MDFKNVLDENYLALSSKYYTASLKQNKTVSKFYLWSSFCDWKCRSHKSSIFSVPFWASGAQLQKSVTCKRVNRLFWFLAWRREQYLPPKPCLRFPMKLIEQKKSPHKWTKVDNLCKNPTVDTLKSHCVKTKANFKILRHGFFPSIPSCGLPLTDPMEALSFLTYTFLSEKT